jgi:hypothetical protein
LRANVSKPLSEEAHIFVRIVLPEPSCRASDTFL